MTRVLTLAAIASVLVSCKGCDPRGKPGGAGAVVDAPMVDAAATAPTVDAAAAPTVDAGAAPTADAGPLDASVARALPGDAGLSSCRLVYGPAEQAFRGPAALSASERELRLVVNDGGTPRLHAIPIAPPPPRGAPPVVPPRPSHFSDVRWPPCALAGRFAYCQAPGGAITRAALGEHAAAPKTIATSRSGTRIAAASLGPDHSIVGFVDLRRTAEGPVLQAFVALDDGEPVRLSEDGAGATALRFLPRGGAAAAVYLDARRAMVPVHARPVSLRGAELALGADAVVFVGGAPERGIDLAVASVGTGAFALVPMPRDALAFGMAALAIDDPPREDVPAVWSPYPNGLDPAPIVAAPAQGGRGAWVARVRPREQAPGAPRVLELGRLDADGAFVSLGEIAPGAKVSDVDLVEDPSGGVWILYGDATITWLERRVCR